MEMIDYTRYLNEPKLKRLHGKKHIMNFLGYVQTRNIPVKEWKKEWLTHEDLFMGDVKESTKRSYHSDLRVFINYVLYYETHKEEKKTQSFQYKNKIAQITGHTSRTGSHKHRTKILPHWSEL